MPDTSSFNQNLAMANGEVNRCEPQRTPSPLGDSSDQVKLAPGDERPLLAWGALFQSARNGSESALGTLLDECRGYLTVIAQQELGSQLRVKVAPSDIVQESLLDAYRGFDKFDGTSEQELLRWLRRTLLNNVADAVKRYRGTARRAINRELPLNSGDPHVGPFEIPTSLSSLPIDKVIRGEEQQRLLAAIRRLPERARRAVVLRNLDARPFSEIGEVLGVSSDAARKIWERAVERLSAELKPNDGSSSIS